MNSSRIAVIAASACSIAWAAKAVAIGLAGGLDRSPAENPLFFLGLASCIVASVALVLSVTVGRPWWVRGAAALGVVVALFVITALLDAAVHGLVDGDHWVLTEVNLWIDALVVLGLSVALDRRSAPVAPMHAPAPAGYASR